MGDKDRRIDAEQQERRCDASIFIVRGEHTFTLPAMSFSVDIEAALASLMLAPPRLLITRNGRVGGAEQIVTHPDEATNADYRTRVALDLGEFLREHPDGRRMIRVDELLDQLPLAVARLHDPHAMHMLVAHDWRLTSVGEMLHWARAEAEGYVLELASRKRKAEEDLAALERLYDRVFTKRRRIQEDSTPSCVSPDQDST